MRVTAAASAIVVCLALGACGSPAATPGAARFGRDQVGPGSTPSTQPTTSRSGKPAPPPASGARPTAAAVRTGPSPVALPWTPSPEVPVDARLSTSCFTRGGIVTLTVHTKPKAGVGYIAVYSDNGTGAPKPTGNGYGGNAGGFSDGNGAYVSTFTVSPDAPLGPGRVDVIVGWRDDKWGYAGPTFAVAGPGDRC